MPVRVFLVRHAEAAPGEPDALRPLTPAGRAAARALGERLAPERLDAVVSSPLRRARETAAAIAARQVSTPRPTRDSRPGATAATLRDAVAGRGETVVASAISPTAATSSRSSPGGGAVRARRRIAELDL